MTIVSEKAEICVGVPIYNGEKYLREAMDRLLAQTFSDFRIVALNDGSTDSSDVIMREYAARDKRIHYLRLEQRSGLIAAWRRTAELADALYHPTYFAWYSDHDYVESNWLETLYEGICNQPDIVLIHPKTLHIDTEGNPVDAPSVNLDTTGVPIWRRLENGTIYPLGAGDAIYGLFRLDAMRKCGIFRDEILPDRLLVSEINLYGAVKYTDKTTRYRRHTRPMKGKYDTVNSQLNTLFPEGYVKKSPHTSYATCLLRIALASEESSDLEFRTQRLYHALLYYVTSLVKLKEGYVQEIDSEDDLGEMGFLKALVASNIQQPGFVTWPEYSFYVKKKHEIKEAAVAKINRLRREKGELTRRLQQDKEMVRIFEQEKKEIVSKLQQEKEDLKRQMSTAFMEKRDRLKQEYREVIHKLQQEKNELKKQLSTILSKSP
jgi:glycosyltransferase involved in cell wall biosynthesis